MLVGIQKNSLQLSGTVPVIEPDLPGAFLTQEPVDIIRSGNIPDVPVIYGANREDGAFVIAGFHFIGFGKKIFPKLPSVILLG